MFSRIYWLSEMLQKLDGMSGEIKIRMATKLARKKVKIKY
jgi:hypothetical protein